MPILIAMEVSRATRIAHGARTLERVTVDDYNAELRDEEGFLGDRASRRAFWEIVNESRQRLREVAGDPLGDTPTEDLGKKKLDRLLAEGDPEAAGLIHGAIEAFTTELLKVIEKLLALPAWQPVERIVVGGGLRGSRVGELVIGRASVRLKSSGRNIELQPIHSDPDEAALIGAIHLAPGGILGGHDAILAVDIGGSNIRAGLVGVGPRRNGGPPKGAVRDLELWRHADEAERPTRDATVERIGAMLSRLAHSAEEQGIALAPFIGVACPGIITAEGRIERGGQNLPGDWESVDFHLPSRLAELGPRVGDGAPVIVLHNDAVVQGLSELPFVDDVSHWAALTIGTGLGNAAFTNRAQPRRPPQSAP